MGYRSEDIHETAKRGEVDLTQPLIQSLPIMDLSA